MSATTVQNLKQSVANAEGNPQALSHLQEAILLALQEANKPTPLEQRRITLNQQRSRPVSEQPKRLPMNAHIDQELAEQIKATATEEGLTIREIMSEGFQLFLEHIFEQRAAHEAATQARRELRQLLNEVKASNNATSEVEVAA